MRALKVHFVSELGQEVGYRECSHWIFANLNRAPLNRRDELGCLRLAARQIKKH